MGINDFTMKYKKVRTYKDIENDERVISIEKEGDRYEGSSYWIYLKDGYLIDGMEISIHEDTIKKCCFVLNNWVTEEP